jgi:hypothetical protein
VTFEPYNRFSKSSKEINSPLQPLSTGQYMQLLIHSLISLTCRNQILWQEGHTLSPCTWGTVRWLADSC